MPAAQAPIVTHLQSLLGISMGFVQHVLLSSGHSQPRLHLADLLLPGCQLAFHLLQSLSVLLHLTPNPLLKLLQKLLLSLQLLLQLLGLVSQLWDASLKLPGFRGTSLWSEQAFRLLALAFQYPSRCSVVSEQTACNRCCQIYALACDSNELMGLQMRASLHVDRTTAAGIMLSD